jgi:hypothetical protein
MRHYFFTSINSAVDAPEWKLAAILLLELGEVCGDRA